MPPEETPQIPKPVGSTAPVSTYSPLKQIRTYQGDIAEALKNQKESVYSIQRQEQQRTERAIQAEPDETPEERASRRNGILLFLGIIILLVAGGIGAFFAYTQYKVKTALPAVTVNPNAYLTPDATTNINALTSSRDALISTLETERGVRVDGKMTQFELRTGALDSSPLLPTETFFSFINSHAPANLVRAFDSMFMLGVLGEGSAGHTFILVPLVSYDNAYPGMLSWETNMRDDLLALVASSTAVDLVPSDGHFVDETIQNKDVRVLKDQNGTTVLAYTFFNNSMVIITDTEDSVKALLSRLSAAQLSR